MSAPSRRVLASDEGTDLESALGVRLSGEGLDDELLRQCARLLSEPSPGTKPARRSRAFRDHLLVAKLALRTGLLDRADEAAEAAVALAPNDEEALRTLAAVHHRRGRLTDAIGIWGRLASNDLTTGSALRQLADLLQRSLHEPTRAEAVLHRIEPQPDELVAELEQSFRLAFSRNVPAALRCVDRVAARARRRDAQLFKLASLQRAWLLDQAGDVTAAILTLERLADVPVLTKDVERLLCLSMLYEREGTPERIRRAVRAVAYAYTETREPTLLRRLARLLDKLGHADVALAFERKYSEIFRRRMHGLSTREIGRAMTLCYVPAARLRRMRPDAGQLAQQFATHRRRARVEHARRAAMLALVAGEGDLARELMAPIVVSGEASRIDRLYYADIEEQHGDVSAARELRRLAVHEEPNDAAALVVALGQSPAHEILEGMSQEALSRAENAMVRHVRAHPGDAPAWRALAEIRHTRGNVDDAASHRAHAAKLSRYRAGGPVRVLAAAAVRRSGRVHGLVHELWVEPRGHTGAEVEPQKQQPMANDVLAFEPSDVLGSVTPDLRASAVNVFYGVLAFVRTHLPHRLRPLGTRLFLKFTKEDEPSSGDSAGLPIAVAAFCALLDLPPPSDTAMSGAIVCDAAGVLLVRPIGDADAKIEGAYERGLERLLLPADNRADVEAAERVPADVARRMVRFVATFEDVCQELFPGLY